MKQQHHGKGAAIRSVLMMLLALLIAGCGEYEQAKEKEYPAISADEAKSFKSGTPLEEIVKVLGEPHPPTAKQAAALENGMSSIPPQARSNAEKDRSLAWGDDRTFLVVKVNDKGIAWMTAWHSGSS